MSLPVQEISSPPVPQRLFSYRVGVVVGYVLIGLLFSLSLFIEFLHLDDNMAVLARERGSVLFRLVELTRDWNALHGGVYVRVTDQVQPNPYLKHPKRDLQTTDGMRLTLVNPAFMTRQIAEIAEKVDGVKYHITSLKPIRPANAPDAWEAEALHSFEQTQSKEKLSLLATPAGPMHRYMAPLLVKEPCLKCHAAQGYEIGQVRGGISISMPAEKDLAVREQQRLRALLFYGVGALAIAALLHFTAWSARRHFKELRKITRGQEALIAERTQALTETNASLSQEVAERQRKQVQILESEARYRSVIETSQNAILIISAPDLRIIFANEQAAVVFALPVEQLEGRCLIDFVQEVDRSRFEDRFARRLRGEYVAGQSRLHFLRPEGTEVRVCDIHVAAIDTTTELGLQWVVNVQDVTERLASERRLQISAAVMENAAEGIIVTDVENRIIEVNPAFTAITGYRPSEVLGKNPKLLGSGRHPPEFFKAMWESLTQHGRWDGEIWNRRRDGTVYPQWLAINLIRGNDTASGGRHVATFIDITQRKETEELLRHKAHSDPLTDLPNRALFYDRLVMVLTHSRRYQEEFALLYIDLDHFKAVNDTLGHAAGDELLIEVAHRLHLAVRESDTVARLGGDEFAVILPKVIGVGEAEEVANRIVKMLAEPYHLNAGSAQISASVGISLYPAHGDEVEKLKRAADSALYEVKKGGRNAYRVFASARN
jgi:diguanylate cyclase (GGDEF)-like protein/PAS domain S-box-containing protein